MKTILFTCLLLGAIAVARAQNSGDPFYDAGYARTMNPRILGGSQATPWLVNSAIHNLRDGGTATAPLVNFLKNNYGYAVWDRSLAITAHGNPTALVPLVFPEGNSITGVLVVVQQDGALRYGIMDLVHPFPFVSSGTQAPGMPGIRDVLAHFAYFNHALFGSAHCSIIHALHATMPQNNGQGDESQAKTCYYHLEVVQNCWEIYGVMSDGTRVHLYTDCVTTINYTTICFLPGGGGFPVYTSGDPNNPVSGTPGSNGSGGPGITDLEDNPCQTSEYTARCATELILAQNESPLSSCNVIATVSGCNFGSCSISLESLGFGGCGGGLLQLETKITYSHCTAYLTSTESSDPTCAISRRCGRVIYRYIVGHFLLGSQIFSRTYESFREACYYCRGCM